MHEFTGAYFDMAPENFVLEHFPIQAHLATLSKQFCLYDRSVDWSEVDHHRPLPWNPLLLRNGLTGNPLSATPTNHSTSASIELNPMVIKPYLCQLLLNPLTQTQFQEGLHPQRAYFAFGAHATSPTECRVSSTSPYYTVEVDIPQGMQVHVDMHLTSKDGSTMAAASYCKSLTGCWSAVSATYGSKDEQPERTATGLPIVKAHRARVRMRVTCLL